MSQTGGPNTVGRLDVVISATGAEATKAQLQEVAVEGGRAADTVKGKFDEFGKALRSPLQSIQRITGAIAGAVAVATTFLAIGKQIGEVLVQWGESGQEYLTRVRETGKRKEEILKLDKQIQEVENTLSEQLGRTRFVGDDLEAGVRASERILKEKRALRDVLRSEDQAQEKIKRIVEQQAEAAKKAAEIQAERAKASKEQSYFAESAAQADEDAANARLDALDAEAKRNEELRKDEEERQAKYLAGLFDEVKFIKEQVRLEKELTEEKEKRLSISKQELALASQARATLKAAFDADTLSADIGRITELLQAIVIQGRVR